MALSARLRWNGLAATAAAFLIAAIQTSAVAAITAEQATHVGGDLTDFGTRLEKLRLAGGGVLAALPQTPHELSAALGRIALARDAHQTAANVWSGVLAAVLISAAMVLYRRATSRLKQCALADALRARGAAGLLAIDAGSWLVLVVGAYLLIEFGFAAGGNQELLGVALVWAFVRWRLFMLALEVILRPTLPAFRLIAMSDRAARHVRVIAGAAILLGVAGISVMPVLLRAGLPIPNGQVIVLVQGALVAAGSALALWRYRNSLARPTLAARAWLWLGGAAIVALGLAWCANVLLLEFDVYHSLAWSLRIGGIAYIVHAILGLSADSRKILFLQRSITCAAILAIAILVAQVWLVTELHLLAPETWRSVRRSLTSAAVTLYIGYVAWRYLHQWTEERVRAAAPGVAAVGDDEFAARPASRLTTVLPVLRILIGVAILVMAGLLALTQLGVEITPLLAGAGVLGLAISFGSQALVRDIVSGIFFMMDDAFRIGEYIDTGRLKGTVERITLRSVRLRHHNGQIHTIPFGQLTSITNFSRDWQTVKFNLRLARDTDLEKVRKAVKQLGQEMLKEPELGKEFLQPLKLQGVAEIADSALVVRLKFTARPLKPSWVQREALKRIYRAFQDKGIEFASNAITVQSPAGASIPASQAVAAAATTPQPPSA